MGAFLQRNVKFRTLYALPSRNFVWCPVFKSASTNWMHNLVRLAGKADHRHRRVQMVFVF